MSDITDEPSDVEERALSEAYWDALFAQSSDLLEALAQEAHEEYLAGEATDFDPDNDPDAPEELWTPT